jgi:Lrp/AsnC family transcriptional regulator, leucine-responsive regulatory protein
MKKFELDSIDRRIISELVADARLPVATIAQRVGLSRHAVQHRIDRLEAEKVIAGYTILLRATEARSSSVVAIMMVYRKDRMRGADVNLAIKKIPEVRNCYVVSGSFDLILYLEAASQERIMQIWDHISKLPGVVDTNTAFILSTIVERH